MASQMLPANQMLVRRRTSCISLGGSGGGSTDRRTDSSDTTTNGQRGSQRGSVGAEGSGAFSRTLKRLSRSTSFRRSSCAVAVAPRAGEEDGERVKPSSDEPASALDAFVLEKEVGFVPLVNPAASFLTRWDWALIGVSVYSLFMGPLAASFLPHIGYALLPLEYTIDLFFFLDMLLRFRLIYVDVWGNLVTDPKAISHKYLEASFAYDLLALLPIELLLAGHLWTPRRVMGMRLNRAFRIVRLVVSEHLEQLTSNLARICRLLLGFLLLAHWIASLFFLVSSTSHSYEESGSYMFNAGLLEDGTSVGRQYLECLYFAIITMVTVGYGDVTPVNSAEKGFMIAASIVSGVVYAAIFGSVALLIQNTGSQWSRYRQRRDDVVQFASLYEIPKPLADKLLEYTSESWRMEKGIDQTAILTTLPLTVRVQVMLHLHQRVIAKVPMFQRAGAAFARALVMRFAAGVVLEGDWLFQEGDIGQEMYVLRLGLLEVVVAHGTADEKVVRVLWPGSFFGEIALILRQRRSASIRAKCRADFFTLTRGDFEELLELFPEQRSPITDAATNRMKQDVRRFEGSGADGQQATSHATLASRAERAVQIQNAIKGVQQFREAAAGAA